ncbi:MAG: hypothetical protein HC842_01780 [Cytophagales bacterium]|nr:hypothetical protein [Cytophagales bacterium]
MKNSLIAISLGTSLLLSCGGKKGPDMAEIMAQMEKDTASTGPAISPEIISDILQQIPSPLEISILLKESGAKYDKKFLNSPDNISKYNSNFSKSLNLGIYGTDLGYTNIYEENQDGLFYLNSIKELADGLSIGQFFDFGTIKKLATNSSNLDSLLLITTQNFNSINTYLQEQKRSNLSILLLTGGWLEAVHITTEVYKKNPKNEALREKIGEQKIILGNIRLLLEFYKDTDPNFNDLYNSIVELDNEYQNIEIIYTYAEPTVKEVDGMLMIEDNSTQEIRITDENIAAISTKADEIRAKIING